MSSILTRRWREQCERQRAHTAHQRGGERAEQKSSQKSDKVRVAPAARHDLIDLCAIEDDGELTKPNHLLTTFFF